MENTKVNVIDVYIGKYECDSLTIELDGVSNEICFNKSDSIIQYAGKEVYLSKVNGVYVIKPVVESAKK